MQEFSRREILATAAALTAAQFGAISLARARQNPRADDAVEMKWVDRAPAMSGGEVFTVPWSAGSLNADDTLSVECDGKSVESQSWPLAYWPDGSVKWSAHAAVKGGAEKIRVVRATPPAVTKKVSVNDGADEVVIDAGPIQCVIRKSGANLIDRVTRGQTTILSSAKLVALKQDRPQLESAGAVAREQFESKIERVMVEQGGPIRAVIRIEGTHTSQSRAWLPFVIRLYFFAGSDQFRVKHTFTFDGDEYKDFICGLGVRFSVPMRDSLHDRHVRFNGEGAGLFAEAVRPLTGLRRDPGAPVRKAQIDGVATPEQETWDRRVPPLMKYIPAWGDFSLSQLCADGFQIRKRTKPGHAWIFAAAGQRAAGVGFVGGPSGGVAFGMRDFWQKHPAQLDVRNAATDNAEVTMWLWSPEAPPMDMRFYHDGEGQQTYPQQLEALNITYEDYEQGYGTPYGIARTSEMFLQIAAATPSREDLVKFADDVRRPAQLVCAPQRYLDAKVFGANWSLEDRGTPFKAALEDNLKFTLDRYVKEVDQRSWYGFWDYGDVMHTYDPDRHVWRYDIGGYAWDNSELSPDLWLWYSFLRTGRGDVFRLAEAMTLHTGEVDVYHIGRFKYLGTRHNVQHWGCSSKQTRISTAAYRRFYYFLTADERVGDLLREQVNEGEAFKKINVGRKLGENAQVLPLPPVESPPAGGSIGVGAMGWGSLMAAWMTEAERTNDKTIHEKIVRSMTGMAALKKGFYAGGWQINLETGAIEHDGSDAVGLSHLTNCFGLPETCAELIVNYGERVPNFAQAWANYGIIYNGTAEEKEKALGRRMQGWSLSDSHSRNTGYAAKIANDDALAQRAWKELLDGRPWQQRLEVRGTKRIEGPAVLNPIDEAMLGTNGSQWQLAAIQCLAYIGDRAPE